jgi:hypothetical protein
VIASAVAVEPGVAARPRMIGGVLAALAYLPEFAASRSLYDERQRIGPAVVPRRTGKRRVTKESSRDVIACSMTRRGPSPSWTPRFKRAASAYG